jgi:ATP-dependent Lon protease
MVKPYQKQWAPSCVLPRRNEKDLDDLPNEVRSTMRFVLVDSIDEVFRVAFASESESDELPVVVER